MNGASERRQSLREGRFPSGRTCAALLLVLAAASAAKAPTDRVRASGQVEATTEVQVAAPVVVVADLDHVWASVYVDEPAVPRLRLGQNATVFTDAGGAGFSGTITYIASKTDFTPRNVQTAEDRSKLVYRIKVTVDNTSGGLKIGMPVEAEIPFMDGAGK